MVWVQDVKEEHSGGKIDYREISVCFNEPGIKGLGKFLPHWEACRVRSKDKVAFEDHHEDGAMGDEQTDARDDRESYKGQEDLVFQSESHLGLEELCFLFEKHLPRPDLQ